MFVFGPDLFLDRGIAFEQLALALTELVEMHDGAGTGIASRRTASAEVRTLDLEGKRGGVRACFDATNSRDRPGVSSSYLPMRRPSTSINEASAAE